MVLKSRIFGQKSINQRKPLYFENTGSPSSSKLGMILENKVVKKTGFFTKKWYPKLMFLNGFFFEKSPSIFDKEKWLWKYDYFGTFWQAIIDGRIVLKKLPLSTLTLGQKSCILRPTIFKVPQPNWHCYTYVLFWLLKALIWSRQTFWHVFYYCLALWWAM